MEAPRRIPIHRSLNRPTLLLGGDRELVLGAGILAGMLVFSVQTWWGVLMGIAVWLAAVGAFSRMGKADPLMRPVFIRHQKYQSYFPAAARWCGKTRSVPLTWKGR
ncbi:MAG: VirB3 family type IV secretion system protein [Anaerolineae bacterium]|jgi:type IV secretion system protein VirB3|nr:VirB3 family type IV secretion system protein [Anaerolineae bacterium]